jgi:hypothetical protein
MSPERVIAASTALDEVERTSADSEVRWNL